MANAVYLTETRDLPLLHFLWRWKLATTAALAARFFPEKRGSTAYRRLWDLERGGFIRVHALEGTRRFVWGLDKAGFQAVRRSLPDLREDGYKSEHLAHDHLVTATHLGDLLCDEPEGIAFCTEQELRRYHIEHYPSWVPHDGAHRPDGYWNLPDGTRKKTFALEVELTHQRRAKYEEIAAFYAKHTSVVRVLWIVPSISMGRSLLDALTSTIRDAASYHNFIAAPELKQLGWGASIGLGPEVGQSTRELLANNTQTSHKHVCAMFAFDTRKSPHRSEGSRKPETPTLRI